MTHTMKISQHFRSWQHLYKSENHKISLRPQLVSRNAHGRLDDTIQETSSRDGTIPAQKCISQAISLPISPMLCAKKSRSFFRKKKAMSWTEIDKLIARNVIFLSLRHWILSVCKKNKKRFEKEEWLRPRKREKKLTGQN